MAKQGLPPLKADPKYGYYPWWPENGDDWIHPEDVALVRTLIPSDRVFRRDGAKGPYIVLHYGELRIRVVRSLWQEIGGEGYEIGDWVEVLSRGQLNTPRTGTIREVHWDRAARARKYQIFENDQPISTWYYAEDLRPVEPTPPLE
jgi:hypothetical protein